MQRLGGCPALLKSAGKHLAQNPSSRLDPIPQLHLMPSACMEPHPLMLFSHDACRLPDVVESWFTAHRQAWASLQQRMLIGLKCGGFFWHAVF
ncbi:hypothetical protein Y1Q_0018474 [Alligator mississippiensis]|uniref:Uncharacterized protein n=1 Tax=Alligator mississippiensis TaxID=8496 RepID=A0A151PC97_ALLMI|nr:hypothetical protein Y1Q_0018474 [Alligator mississippiensis]